jgi:hypothetical protein
MTGSLQIDPRLANTQQHSLVPDILIREKRQRHEGRARSEKNVLNQRRIAPLFLMAVLGVSEIRAQEPAAATQTPSHDAPAIVAKNMAKGPAQEHRFWDKKNGWLFAGVGASRTLDYFSTLNLRRRGDQEVLLTNEIVDNHAGFAAIEAAGTGVSIGASYLFHRYGHHKLERWTSIVHIGLTTTGAVRNYCLKTAHPKTLP